jgi:ParB family chromosome partitioning protein
MSERPGKGSAWVCRRCSVSAPLAAMTSPGRWRRDRDARIRPNPNQPRQRFDEEALKELADLIAAQNTQPILCAPKARIEIIAGERRWRAAQSAQLHGFRDRPRDRRRGHRRDRAH